MFSDVTSRGNDKQSLSNQSKSPKEDKSSHALKDPPKSFASMIFNSPLFKWHNAKSDDPAEHNTSVTDLNEHIFSSITSEPTDKKETTDMIIPSPRQYQDCNVTTPLQQSLDMIKIFTSHEIVEKEEQIVNQVQENIELAWRKSSIPPKTEELKEFFETQISQIDYLHEDLSAKNEEINDLRKQLENFESSNKSKKVPEDLHRRMSSLEEEIKLLKRDYLQRTQFQENLNKLFALDYGDHKHSIENFYFMTVNRLIAFAIAVKALDSGLVARNPSWKDNLASIVFGFLDNMSQIVGGGVNFFFGSGVILPLVTLPIINGADFLWEHYQDNTKSKEFQNASQKFKGSFEDIEKQIKYTAFQLAHLLIMQLRYCTLEGAQQIVDDWLYRLCYNLLKDGNNEGDLDVIFDLIKIRKGKEQKHDIKTYGDRKWNTLGLFNKAGIAYYKDDQLIFESCFARALGQEPKKVTRAKKYGYLIFPNYKEAMGYKQVVTESLEKKYSGKNISWERDKKSLGPQIFTEDQFLISSPTLVPSKPIVQPLTDLIQEKLNHHHSQPSSEFEKLTNKIKNLEELNNKLNNDLQTQKESLKVLMDHYHLQVKNEKDS